MNIEILILTFVIVVLMFAGMSIGVIVSNRRVKGSCGGIGLVMGDTEQTCEFCGNTPGECDENLVKEKVTS
ncbi:MAG: (Na+)-NQR maturation NqrM [Spirochaetota bacterium]